MFADLYDVEPRSRRHPHLSKLSSSASPDVTRPSTPFMVMNCFPGDLNLPNSSHKVKTNPRIYSIGVRQSAEEKVTVIARERCGLRVDDETKNLRDSSPAARE